MLPVPLWYCRDSLKNLNHSRFGWLGSVATLFSLAACYGTLAAIGILGVLGISIAFDETLWAGTIIAFAVLAVGGLGLGLLCHRQPWPILIGGLGVGILGYVMYVQYDRLTEIFAFILLCLAAFWDWRLRRRLAVRAEPCGK